MINVQRDIEKEILQGIFKHDDTCWKKLIDIYGRLIFHNVRKTIFRKGIRIPDHDLEDLYQDFLLSLIENDFKKLKSFRFECSLKTWLILLSTRFVLICVNKIFSQPLPKILDGDPEKIQNIIESIQDQRLLPDENLEDEEIRGLMNNFIERLDEIDRDIFLLFFVKKKPPKEIISIMEIPRATIYRKIKIFQKDFLIFYRSITG